jgi:hypothetical protein
MNDKGNKENELLYYLEDGLIVFTAAYHLKRGYCCKSGCRHCPYDRKTNKPKPGTARPDVGETGESNP